MDRDEWSEAAAVMDLPTEESSSVTPEDDGVVHTITGEVRHHHDFPSRFLPRSRDIVVYLPPGYSAESERRYPVFYMHDGQNLFDAATAFGGREWHVDETAEALIRAGEVQPVIIVGIYNTGDARIGEYTPSKDARHPGSGKARLYGRLLIEEIKPFIDAEYRTLPDRENTAIGGSSLGGLVSLFLGLSHPELFSRLALMSPSVWWGRSLVVRKVLTLAKKPDLKIWLDIGTAEGAQAVRNVHMLRDALLEKGWRPGEDLAYFEADNGRHDEDAWASRMPMVLKYFYSKE